MNQNSQTMILFWYILHCNPDHLLDILNVSILVSSTQYSGTIYFSFWIWNSTFGSCSDTVSSFYLKRRHAVLYWLKVELSCNYIYQILICWKWTFKNGRKLVPYVYHPRIQGSHVSTTTASIWKKHYFSIWNRYSSIVLSLVFQCEFLIKYLWWFVSKHVWLKTSFMYQNEVLGTRNYSM